MQRRICYTHDSPLWCPSGRPYAGRWSCSRPSPDTYSWVNHTLHTPVLKGLQPTSYTAPICMTGITNGTVTSVGAHANSACLPICGLQSRAPQTNLPSCAHCGTSAQTAEIMLNTATSLISLVFCATKGWIRNATFCSVARTPGSSGTAPNTSGTCSTSSTRPPLAQP